MNRSADCKSRPPPPFTRTARASTVGQLLCIHTIWEQLYEPTLNAMSPLGSLPLRAFAGPGQTRDMCDIARWETFKAEVREEAARKKEQAKGPAGNGNASDGAKEVQGEKGSRGSGRAGNELERMPGCERSHYALHLLRCLTACVPHVGGLKKRIVSENSDRNFAPLAGVHKCSLPDF